MDDFHLVNRLLYKINALCVPENEIIQLIREAHTFIIVGYFRVGSIISYLQRYVYWIKMQEQVTKYV